MAKGNVSGLDAISERALTAKRESKAIEFKETLDTGSPQDWCEVIKDIVAIANSGGGIILVGVHNTGSPVDSDITGLLSLDPAAVADKIFSYTSTSFADVQIAELHKASKPVAGIRIGPAEMPVVFTRPGTYAIANGKQASAFSKGTVYFRHGAKSEPGTTEDLRSFFERLVARVRKEWMRGVRKVVHAPPGYSVAMLPPEIRDSDAPTATPIRIVDDPSAPGYRIVNADKTHPYRQKELVEVLNERLPAGMRVNSFDIQCIRNVHKIDSNSNFFHRPRFGSPQYSEKLVEWLLKKTREDRRFFRKARRAAAA